MFLDTFKIKKTPNLNSTYHMKLFDTQINCFCGHNLHNDNFFFLG